MSCQKYFVNTICLSFVVSSTPSFTYFFQLDKYSSNSFGHVSRGSLLGFSHEVPFWDFRAQFIKGKPQQSNMVTIIHPEYHKKQFLRQITEKNQTFLRQTYRCNLKFPWYFSNKNIWIKSFQFTSVVYYVILLSKYKD